MRGWGWSWHVGLGLLLFGCPGEVTPGGSAGDGSSTGDQPGITTFNSTVDPTVPGEGEAESMEGEGSAEGTTMEALDGTTTDGGMTSEPGTSSGPGSTTDSGTTSGSTTDPGTTSGSTNDPGSTSGSTTDPGSTSGSTTDSGSTSGTTSGTTGGGCHSVAGNYESCLNMDGTTSTAPCMAPGDSTCLIAGGMPPTAGLLGGDRLLSRRLVVALGLVRVAELGEIEGQALLDFVVGAEVLQLDRSLVVGRVGDGVPEVPVVLVELV